MNEFPLPTPNSAPNTIVAGPDGNVWFMETGRDALGKITPGGQVTDIPLPVPAANADFAFGPAGNIWLGLKTDIAEITPQGTLLHDYAIASASPPGIPDTGINITVGPDGNIWYVEPYTNDLIGRLTPDGTAHPSIQEFPVPGDAFGHWGAANIIMGPDGNLWCEATGNNEIARITTAGSIQTFTIPVSSVRGLTAGPDGNLWMTVSNSSGNEILQVNTQGQVTGQFAIPIPNSGAYGMTVGSDGTLWFTEYNANQIGRITTAGQITEYASTTGTHISNVITTGPDGNIWFSESAANSIGKIATGPRPTPAAPFQVTTTANGGPGSLRDAIAQIDADPAGYIGSHGIPEIDFALPWGDSGHVYYQGTTGNIQPVPTGTTSDADLANASVVGTGQTIASQWPHSWWRIQPATPLPDIATSVYIDGYKQNGARMNEFQYSDDAVLRVALDGSSTVPDGSQHLVPFYTVAGLNLRSGSSTVRGLAIGNFAGCAIEILSDGNTVAGNFVGTDVSGTLRQANLVDTGVAIIGAADVSDATGSHNRIGTYGTGTPDYADRNIIAANGGLHLALNGPRSTGVRVEWGASYNTISGNYIGTDASGTQPLGNGGWGIVVYDNGQTGGSGYNQIGGNVPTDLIDGNVIAANSYYGVAVGGVERHNTLYGNAIGTDASGTTGLGNGRTGVIAVTGVQDLKIAGNVIAYNGEYGVVVTQDTVGVYSDSVHVPSHSGPTDGIQIEDNSIHDNGALGIDLGGTFDFGSSDPGLFALVTPLPGPLMNDSQGQAGPNDFQDFPVLTDDTLTASGTTVTGTLPSTTPGGTYHLEFYANAAPDPTGYGQGETYLGFATVMADAHGYLASSPDGTAVITNPDTPQASFTATSLTAAPSGQVYISATATNLQTGDTSEFSQDLQPASQPPVAVAALDPNANGGKTQFNEGDTIYFLGTGSHNVSGTPMTYLWDFGDGTTSTDPNPAYVYQDDKPSGYTVTLTVTNLGRSNTATMTVIVNNVPPAPEIGEPEVEIDSIPTDADGDPAPPEGTAILLLSGVYDPGSLDNYMGFTYAWTVSGGPYAISSTDGSSGQEFVFTPEDNGRYTVTLTTFDQDGASGTTSQTFDVTDVPPSVQIASGVVAGDLDPAFHGGTTVTGLAAPGVWADVSTTQPDGKIVVAGTTGDYAGYALLRYNTDGTLDTTFGTDGEATTYFSTGAYENVTAVAVAPNGDILVAGTEGVTCYDVFGALVNDPVTGFGPSHSGTISPPFGTTTLAVQSDGAILVGGTAPVTIPDPSNPGSEISSTDFGVVRYLSNGLIDPTFGNQGQALVDFGVVSPDWDPTAGGRRAALSDIVVQPDGKILLAGTEFDAGFNFSGFSNWGAMARLDSFGHLDPNFGAGGIVAGVSSIRGGPSGPPVAIALEPDGNILMADTDFISRFDPQGSPDPSFGTVAFYPVQGLPIPPSSGLFVTQTIWGSRTTGGVSGPVFLIPQPDDSITLVGPAYDDSGVPVPTLERFGSDGTPDASFGTGGVALSDVGFTPETHYLAGAVPAADGRVIVVASGINPNTVANPPDVGLARFVTVNRVVPEGAPVTMACSVQDPSYVDTAAGFTYAWTVADNGTTVATGSNANLTFTPADNGTYTVSLTVSDKDGGTTTDTRTFTVQNVPPTASVAGPSQGVVNQPLSFTLGATDPSSADQAAGFGYSIDWGDGSAVESDSGRGSGLPDQHTYLQPGTYTVQVWATDKDGGQSPTPATLTVTISNVVQQGSSLSVGGDGTVALTQGSVIVTLNGQRIGEYFGVTGAITIFGGTGDDTITVASSLTNPVTIYGDGGNDTLEGGSGTNTLVGGSGTTTFIDNGGTNTIMGGSGQNLFVPGGGHNIFQVPPGAAAPIVFADQYSVFDNGVLSPAAAAGVLANDLSANGHALSAVLLAGPAHGTLSLNADGSFRYTPAANYVGVDSFRYQARGTDGSLSATASVSLQVTYHFSGFLPPLSQNMAFALGRTIPVKFQLTDATGAAITSVNAITSLQIQALDASGNPLGAPFNPTSADSAGPHYDGSEFLLNWQTKGLTAGSYQIVLTLTDGTAKVRTVQLTPAGASGRLVTDGTSGTALTGGLLGGDVVLYVDNSNGDLTSDELTRIDDAVAAVDATLVPYGVTITEVSDPALANVTLTMHSTSPAGGYADGVLGCTTDSGQVTIIAGWNFYAGSDATQIGAGQYDFQTVVTHELGHVLGLGHSTDATSVMYATLDTGAVKRVLVTADLNVSDADGSACGLHVAQPARPPSPVFQPMTHGLTTVDWLFANLARPTLAPLGAGVSEPLTDSNRPTGGPGISRLPLWATSDSRAAVSPWESLGGPGTEVDARLAEPGLDGNLATGEAFDWMLAPRLWWTVV